MKVMIRVDWSVALGSGHVMRCIALAQALKKSAEVVFIGRMLRGTAAELFESAGFRFIALPPLEHLEDIQPGILGTQWENDWAQFARALDDEGTIDWIAVDHYGIPMGWETAARRSGARVLVLDDLFDRQHDCDLLVNPNAVAQSHAERYSDLLPDDCQTLVGTRYSLLRQEFASRRQEAKQRDGTVQRVLVNFGGSDITNETAKALPFIASAANKGIRVDVVIGTTNPQRNELQGLCASIPNVTLHVQSNRMAELMLAADFALGAGGGGALERCCLGLPTLVVSVARNQEAGSRELARRGAAVYLGPYHAVDQHSLHMASETFGSNKTLLEHIAHCALSEVDGRGAVRVARAMVGSRVDLRLATTADKQDLLEWRNRAEVRRGALDQKQIAASEHERWFTHAMANPNCALLIGQVAGQPIGVLRYDINGARANVSVYLIAENIDQGLGPVLVREGDQWLHETRPEIQEVHAVVRADNPRSQAAFVNAGYDLHGALLRKVFSHGQ